MLTRETENTSSILVLGCAHVRRKDVFFLYPANIFDIIHHRLSKIIVQLSKLFQTVPDTHLHKKSGPNPTDLLEKHGGNYEIEI